MESFKKSNLRNWLLFLATIVVVFVLGLFASSIIERRSEAQFVNTPKVEIGEFEPRNEIWGKNFPKEYQSYIQTADTSFKSKYNGSAMIDMLEVDPRLVVLWAGYPFSKDYNQGRGHYNAIEDIRNTLRVGAPVDGNKSPLPNTCWACKSPDVPRRMNELIKDKGDTKLGIAAFYSGSWDTQGHEIVNNIGCADCHDSKTI